MGGHETIGPCMQSILISRSRRQRSTSDPLVENAETAVFTTIRDSVAVDSDVITNARASLGRAPSSEMSDEKLMLAFARGNTNAFEQLFAQHKGGVYRYFLKLTHSAEDAEDLTQEIWINVLRNREKYLPKSKFTTWLYSIAHNRLIDYYRKNARGVPISYEDDTQVDDYMDATMMDPSQQLESNRQIRDVFAAIDALPEAQREAFLLREEGGMSLDEIAEATLVTRETAKSRLRYAVAKLRRSVTLHE